MYAQPTFGGSEVPSNAGMNCQMPSKAICARFEFCAITLASSQFRAVPAGSAASADCVAAIK
jgi:hypothetical protein